jgi:hypothetical protein
MVLLMNTMSAAAYVHCIYTEALKAHQGVARVDVIGCSVLRDDIAGGTLEAMCSPPEHTTQAACQHDEGRHADAELFKTAKQSCGSHHRNTVRAAARHTHLYRAGRRLLLAWHSLLLLLLVLLVLWCCWQVRPAPWAEIGVHVRVDVRMLSNEMQPCDQSNQRMPVMLRLRVRLWMKLALKEQAIEGVAGLSINICMS